MTVCLELPVCVLQRSSCAVPRSEWTTASVCYPEWSSSQTDSGTCPWASPWPEGVGSGRHSGLPSPVHTSPPNHWAMTESHCAAPERCRKMGCQEVFTVEDWQDTLGKSWMEKYWLHLLGICWVNFSLARFHENDTNMPLKGTVGLKHIYSQFIVSVIDFSNPTVGDSQ